MNLNEFAVKVTKIEGLKKQISIAQVKEMIKILFKELSKMKDEEVSKLLARYKEVKKKK